ncbi:MAG: Hint domain-containing protein [Candidatus Aenigmarchaeota archaeon]|nr:Hint domain-containing protein [Candidatus Aenigmarchaeota archaeon]
MPEQEHEEKLKTKFALKKLVKQLGSMKGRHTELVTVYVPANYSLHEILGQLRNEQSTADNIKSKPVRKNVTTALEKIMRHIQLYKKTPENGLALFCGNVSMSDARTDIELWAIEPPEPIKTKMYWCDQRFVLDPLQEMVAEKEIYGIINLDKSEASVALLIGKKIEPIFHKESIVPGKTRAGGQCFARGTKVRCVSGAVPIEAVKIGDDIISYDAGQRKLVPAKVRKKFEKEARRIYTITAGTQKIITTPEHVFFVSNKSYFKEKSAFDLSIGEFLVLAKKGKTKESRILSIKKEAKTISVFDLSVERHENYIANNLLVHNSSARFGRIREGLLNDWLKQVGEAANKIFTEHKEVLGIILSGPGPIKDMFLKEDYVFADVRKKIIGTVDTSYTGPHGLEETLERGEALLKELGVTKEKLLLQKFFNELQKPHGLVTYGFKEVLDALEIGAVDTVIVSESSELKIKEYTNIEGETKLIAWKPGVAIPEDYKMIGEMDVIEYFEEKAKSYGSKVIVVSADTREGLQFAHFGGIGALLRYNI